MDFGSATFCFWHFRSIRWYQPTLCSLHGGQTEQWSRRKCHHQPDLGTTAGIKIIVLLVNVQNTNLQLFQLPLWAFLMCKNNYCCVQTFSSTFKFSFVWSRLDVMTPWLYGFGSAFQTLLLKPSVNACVNEFVLTLIYNVTLMPSEESSAPWTIPLQTPPADWHNWSAGKGSIHYPQKQKKQHIDSRWTAPTVPRTNCFCTRDWKNQEQTNESWREL